MFPPVSPDIARSVKCAVQRIKWRIALAQAPVSKSAYLRDLIFAKAVLRHRGFADKSRSLVAMSSERPRLFLLRLGTLETNGRRAKRG